MPPAQFGVIPDMPPGMQSPGALLTPFTPDIPFPPNDAPVAGAPYVIAQAAGGNSSYTLKVQTRTNRGDAILVSAIAPVNTFPVVTCTDTQGNAYVTTTPSPFFGPQQLVAVNPVPLGPSDSLTVTVVGGGFGGRSAVIAVGVPAALAGAGAAFLAPDLGNIANTNSSGNSSTAVAAKTPAGVAVPAGELIFAAVMIEGVSTGGVVLPQLPQGWNVIATVIGTNATYPEFVLIAWKLNATQIPAGSAVVSTIQAAGNLALSACYTTFMAETRFAPKSPPDMPPGMQSPGAWQLQPGFDAPQFTADYNEVITTATGSPALAPMGVSGQAVVASVATPPATPGPAWQRMFQPWRKAAQQRQQPPQVITGTGSAALAPLAVAGTDVVAAVAQSPALPGPSWRRVYQPWRRAAQVRQQPPAVIAVTGSAALAPMATAGSVTGSPELAPAAALPGPSWRRAFQPWRRAAAFRIQPPAVITAAGSTALAPMAVTGTDVVAAVAAPPAMPGPAWRRVFQPWRRAAGARAFPTPPPPPSVTISGSAALAGPAVTGTVTIPPPQLRAGLLGGTVTGSTYSGTVTDSNTYGGSAQ